MEVRILCDNRKMRAPNTSHGGVGAVIFDFGEAAPITIGQLAAAQGVTPLVDVSSLEGGFPADEDIDDFLQDIYSSRRVSTE